MNIAGYIDHTILKPTTTAAEVERVCSEALAEEFAAVCVPPYFVRQACKRLQGSSVKVATVVGFPFGYSAMKAKLKEIEIALADGADELDVVHNIAALKEGNYEYLGNEMDRCIELVHNAGKVIKVIIESGELSDEELLRCCELYGAIGIDFMKTSTGYAKTGATVHAVTLMRKNLPETVGIKASGGIRNFAFAKELIDAGATRLGCSAGMEIVRESKNV